MQIMQPAIPQLQAIAKEGESGRQKINQWTHWLTVPLAMLQAYGTPNLINFSTGGGAPIIRNFGFDQDPLGTLAIIISMTAGTLVLVWMGELITQYGVGQGVSIIIFGGIIARLPDQILQSFAAGLDIAALLIFGVLAVITVVAIIYVYEGQRRIPIQISKQIRGDRVYGGGTTHVPLKVNSAGMIPLIFASSTLILPGTIASYFVGSSIAIVATIAQFFANTFNPNGANSWVYLQVAQLQRRRLTGNHLSCVCQLLTGREFALGMNDLGPLLAFGFRLFCHGALHRVGKLDVAHFDARHFYSPGARLLIDYLLESLIDPVALGQ